MPRKPNRPPSTNPPPGARLLTEHEVLAIIRMSRPTLDRWVREGTFPMFVKLHTGGAKRWLASEVEDWLASRSKARTG
jgi:predicted DNA-binding transcriptional regulator AlpA